MYSAALAKALGSMVGGPTLAVVSNPSLAVLRGAVLFGLNQKTIASRVMQHTFGIETSEDWHDDFEAVIPRTTQLTDDDTI